MYAHLKGVLTEKTPTSVVLETGGIGYLINISLNTYAQIEQATEAKLLTYLSVKEDSLTLYGFGDDAERRLFIHLISVSGIGPNTARVMLSSLTPAEARRAIIQENVPAINKVKGIGPKTAKRMIIELKDKLIKEGGDVALDSVDVNSSNTIRDEALSALVALGFNRSKVRQVVDKFAGQTDQVEDLIKMALKNLS